MHEVKPTVELVDANGIGATVERDIKLYLAYRRCYTNEDLFDGGVPGSDGIRAFVEKMLKPEHAHESPLEHVSFTFHITCTRACSHQLVRHRIASYSQQSQRYVRANDLPYILPPLDYLTAEEREVLHNEYREDVAYAERAYARKIQRGAKAEDARSVLPNMVATYLITTMNLRSLRHFFNERCCHRAQWEIRSIANQMLDMCKSLCPAVFKDSGPHCLKIKHCPEHQPCGKRPWANDN